MLYDKMFLKELDLHRNKTIFAKITALSMDERPLESIEGRVTQGSINVDGASAVRRTCSLSIVTNDIDISNYLWTLNTKFKLEIGLKNGINQNYPSIIWFNQGTYLITSFSTALQATSFTINIQGKDKMCRLNGENGGLLQSSVDFGKMEEIDEKGNRIFIQQKLKDIVRDMVHAYGGEPYHNIIINDLDTPGLMLEEYKNNEPLFLVRKAEYGYTGEYEMGYINGCDYYCLYRQPNGFYKACTFAQLPVYDSLIETLAEYTEKPTEFYILTGVEYQRLKDNNSISVVTDLQDMTLWCAAKIEQGQVAGYSETELTYTGDLIANAGESITSVLDKIKNMLGDFEYFYNLDGQFVFQKNKNYINTSWAPKVMWGQDNEDYIVEAYSDASAATYSFLGNELLTAFNNTPNLANLKNDYSVWGERSVAGGTIPIHIRYAIDKKPQSYTTVNVYDYELIDYNNKFKTQAVGQKSITYIAVNEIKNYFYDFSSKTLTFKIIGQFDEIDKKILKLAAKYEYDVNKKELIISYSWPTATEDMVFCDWRELIYRMALDYRKYNHLDDFLIKVANANIETYPSGMTGYEQYYIDLEGFWRQLYSLETIYEEVPFTYFTELYNIEQELNKIEKIKEEQSLLAAKNERTIEENNKYITLLTEESSRIAKENNLIQKKNKLKNYLDNCWIKEKEYFEYQPGLEEYDGNPESRQGLILYKQNTSTEYFDSYEKVNLIKDSLGQYIYAKGNEVCNQPYVLKETYGGREKDEAGNYLPFNFGKYYIFPSSNEDSLYEVTCIGTKQDITSPTQKYYTIKKIEQTNTVAYPYYTIENKQNIAFDSLARGDKGLFKIIAHSSKEEDMIYYAIEQVYKLEDLSEDIKIYTKNEYYLHDLISFNDYQGEQKQNYYEAKVPEDEIKLKEIYYTHIDNYIRPVPKNDLSIKETNNFDFPFQVIEGAEEVLSKATETYTLVKNSLEEQYKEHENAVYRLGQDSLDELIEKSKFLALLNKSKKLRYSEINDFLKNNDSNNETIVITAQDIDDIEARRKLFLDALVLSHYNVSFTRDEEELPVLKYSTNSEAIGFNDLKTFLENYADKKENFMKPYREAFLPISNVDYSSFMSVEKFDDIYSNLIINVQQWNDAARDLWLPNETKEYIPYYGYLHGLILYYYQNWYKNIPDNYNCTITISKREPSILEGQEQIQPGTISIQVDGVSLEMLFQLYLSTFENEKTIDKELVDMGISNDSTIRSISYLANEINNNRAVLQSLASFIETHDFKTRPMYGRVLNPINDEKDNYLQLIQQQFYHISEQYYSIEDKRKYWSKTVYESPDTLNFWFDFLDTSGELEQYSVRTVGIRPKVVNDKDVKAIYQKNAPLVIYHENKNIVKHHTGYSYINIGENIKTSSMENIKIIDENLDAIDINGEPIDIKNLSKGMIGRSQANRKFKDIDGEEYEWWEYQTWDFFGEPRSGWRGLKDGYSLKTRLFVNSAQGKTAKEAIDQLLYNHSYCTESASITAVPVYYLEPNTRIYIFDINTGIEGDYLLSKMTIPLSYNGTMTMTATKAIDRII